MYGIHWRQHILDDSVVILLWKLVAREKLTANFHKCTFLSHHLARVSTHLSLWAAPIPLALAMV